MEKAMEHEIETGILYGFIRDHSMDFITSMCHGHMHQLQKLTPCNMTPTNGPQLWGNHNWANNLAAALRLANIESVQIHIIYLSHTRFYGVIS